jgi:putative transposase
MEESSGKLVAFPQESSRDVLSEVLREGARRMLSTAIEGEVQGYLAAREELVDDAGHRLVVRNGYLPARTLCHRSS